MKKENIYAIIAIIVFILGILAFLFFDTGISLSKDFIISRGGTLSLENIDMANIEIISTDKNWISAEINGSKKDINKLRLFGSGTSSVNFVLPNHLINLRAKIFVPKNININIKLSEKNNVNISNLIGGSISRSSGSFTIESNDFETIVTGDDSGVIIQTNDETEGSCENTVVFEDEDNDASENGTGTGSGSNYQSPSSPVDDGGDEEIIYESNTPTACLVGPQNMKNSCCRQKNIDTIIPDCPGSWILNTDTSLCEFRCLSEDELENGVGTNDSTLIATDEIS